MKKVAHRTRNDPLETIPNFQIRLVKSAFVFGYIAKLVHNKTKGASYSLRVEQAMKIYYVLFYVSH